MVDTPFTVSIGPHVFHSALRRQLREQYREPAAIHSSRVIFDLSEVRGFELLEISMLLAWTSKCKSAGKSVMWELPECVRLSEAQYTTSAKEEQQSYKRLMREVELLTGKMGLSEIQNRIEYAEKTLRTKVRDKQYPKNFPEYMRELQGELTSHYPNVTKHIQQLCGVILGAVVGMRVIGFAKRLGALSVLESIGCRLSPEDVNELAWPYSFDEAATGTLPFRWILSAADLDSSIRTLGDQDELARVFSTYAKLDIIRSGALSNVIVGELGNNIVEHAHSSLGVVGTRIISSNHMRSFRAPVISSNLPRFFKSVRKTGFLEVVICDDGDGIPVTISDTFVDAWKLREDMRSQFPVEGGEPGRSAFEDWHFIEFAFDRLSSSKKTAREIFEIPWRSDNHKCDTGVALKKKVASGLFWVWNLARRYQGFVMVRSGEAELAYDFSDLDENGKPRRYTDECNMCGTQIWICLPLLKRSEGLYPQITTASQCEESASFRFHWVGAFASATPVCELHKDPEPARLSRLYEQMKSAFEKSISENSVFVLDLSGTHSGWFTNNSRYLANALIQLNYLSPMGHHGAVLFNAPVGDRAALYETFIEHCRAIGKAQPELAALHLAAAIFWDDGKSVDFLSPSPSTEEILGMFGGCESDLSATDVRMNLSGKFRHKLELDEIDRIIAEHAQLFRELPSKYGERRFALNITHELLSKRAREAFSCELTEIAQNENMQSTRPHPASNCPFVRRFLPEEGAFWLPSSARLARVFYQVGVLASHAMWRSRIGWLIADEVRRLERCGNDPLTHLVTVTRSTPHFLAEAKEFLRSETESPGLLMEDDLESLSRALVKLTEDSDNSPDEHRCRCLLFTDVISTGNLAAKAAELLEGRGIKVISVFAVADVRSTNDLGDDRFPVRPRCIVQEDVEKDVVKDWPDIVRLVDIDELEVCPVGSVPPSLWNSSRQRCMWLLNPQQLLEVAQQQNALLTGHYHVGDYHHYVHYLVADWLLEALMPDDQRTVRTELATIMKSDLGESTPEDTVILHPDTRISRCQKLVNMVTHITGAEWKHTIYRERHGPRWSFSAFVRHGVPMSGKTVVIVDDGSCSGDTLVAMVETAALGGAQELCVYFLIDRMPLVKSDLIARIQTVQGVEDTCNVRFRALGGVQIPAYTQADCPICRFARQLDSISESYVAMGRIARDLQQHLTAVPVPAAPNEDVENHYRKSLPWATPSDVAPLWRIRQSLGYYPYEIPSLETQEEPSLKRLDRMMQNEEALLAFAFLVCTEPLLMEKKWFRARACELGERWINMVCASNTDEKRMTTLVEAVFRLDQSLGPLHTSKGSDAAIELLAQLPNDKRGETAVQRLILLVAITAEDGDTARASALRWVQAIDTQSEEGWNEYPLQYAGSILRQTLYLGRSFGVIPTRRELSEGNTFYELACRILDFFARHRLKENVESPIDTLLKVVDRQPDKAVALTPEHMESLRRLLGHLDLLIRFTEEIASFGAHVYHPLIPRPDGSHKEAIQALSRFHDAILRVVTRRAASGRECKEKWNECRGSVLGFMTWLFPKTWECVLEERDAWMNDHDWPPKILLSPEKSPTCFCGFMPSNLTKHFIKTCLDNVVKHSYPDIGTWEPNHIQIALKRQGEEIVIAFRDAGSPFGLGISKEELDEKLKTGTLAELEREVQPFGGMITYPQKGDCPKLFSLTLCSVESSPSCD